MRQQYVTELEEHVEKVEQALLSVGESITYAEALQVRSFVVTTAFGFSRADITGAQ